MTKSIHIVHLYPKEMNIYGDTGNMLILKKRLEWREFEVKVSRIGIGESIPTDVDIIVGGGGQDAGQDKIQADLQTKSFTLRTLAENGTVMFMVCGMYQLFGRSFTTSEGAIIKGIGILPLETTAGPTRFIGNTHYKTEYGELVGYENHSGVTVLDKDAVPFGKCLRGAGNNGQDKTEGCVVSNVFGTYSHGPLLSKNPTLADELLQRAVEKKYPGTILSVLDDTAEITAYTHAMRRPR